MLGATAPNTANSNRSAVCKEIFMNKALIFTLLTITLIGCTTVDTYEETALKKKKIVIAEVPNSLNPNSSAVYTIRIDSSGATFHNGKKITIAEISNSLSQSEAIIRVPKEAPYDVVMSTLKELKTLYPRLSKNGVLMIDDYGHHKGSKKAVDDFFRNKKIWLLYT